MAENVQKGSITVGDFTFSYTLYRRAVKNLNLRVLRDGEVAVSASPRVPLARIERFLSDKADFVRRAKARVLARGAAEPPLTLAEGERVPILGVLHTVCHRIEKKPRVWCEEGRLVLALPDPADAAARVRAFERYVRERAREVLTALTMRYAPAFVGDVPPPAVSVRQMKSRWGSCFYTRRAITYNTHTLFLPLPLAELVVCHELAHLCHHDHSAAFYARLASVLPDHRARLAQLKTAHVPRFACS